MATQLENAQRKCAEAEAAHAALQASSKLLEQQHAELQQKQAEQASAQGEGGAAAGDPLPKLSVIHLTCNLVVVVGLVLMAMGLCAGRSSSTPTSSGASQPFAQPGSRLSDGCCHHDVI